MYKKWFGFLLMINLTLFVRSQTIKIPKKIDSAFVKKYPEALMSSWNNKYANYEVTYQLGETMMKSEFSSKGEWVKTETKIIYSQLPSVVSDSFKVSGYSKIPVKDVIKTEQKNRPVQYTIITMKGALNKTSHVFSEKGHLISERNFL